MGTQDDFPFFEDADLCLASISRSSTTFLLTLYGAQMLIKKIVSEIREQMKLTSPSLPIFLICDSFNRVVYIQQGYTINIGEQILKVIGKL